MISAIKPRFQPFVRRPRGAMAGDAMEVMPMSPRQSPAEIGNAVIAWARSRRGRTLVLSAVFMVLLVGLMGAKHSEVCCLLGLGCRRRGTLRRVIESWR